MPGIGEQFEIALDGLDIDKMYSPMSGFYSVVKEPGETIPRRFRKSYLTIAENRLSPVDFDSIPALMKILECEAKRELEAGEQIHWAITLAYHHLLNAKNTELRRDIRQTHFDIAGARVAEFALNGAIGGPQGEVYKSYIRRFVKAGGV